MELSQNLKKTEIGIIPNEWSISYLDEVSSIGSGKRLPLGKLLSDKVTPHPYIRVTDMNRGSVELSGIKYVPEDVYPSIKNYRIFCNDIFISVAGNGLGQVGKIPKELDGANLTENANRIYNLKCSQDYLLHVMSSPIIQKVIVGTITVGAQPKLALTRIRKFKIPLPPTSEEQQAIADALSNTDGYIESLEKLIAKKRIIKKGVMQDLLTGKRRSPSFTKKWIKSRIGDLLQIEHGKSQKEVESSNGTIPILATGGQIGWANKFLCDKPSVLIGRKGTIDRPQYMETPFWTVDTLFYSTVLTPNSAKFLFYRFCLINWMALNEASGVPSLNARTIEAMEIEVPESDEQKQIAAVLTDIDTDIALLDSRLDKARLLKQGMMQELLTGRIRLV